MSRKIQWFVVFAVFSCVAAFGQQSNIQFTPYGYIKFDSTYDTARTAYGDLALWVLPEGADGGDEKELNFSARETRLGLNIVAPESRGVKVSGRVEMDFYEEISTPNKYSPRLRLAYLDLAWKNGWSLRFGQDWDTYVSFHPEMVDASAFAYTGHPYGRHPQIRLTKDMKLGENTDLTLKLALQHGRNGSNIDGDGQPDENAGSAPNFHGSLALKPRLLTDRQSVFAIAGVYGREKLTGSANPGTYESWLIHGSVQLPISRQFTLQGIAWKGENLDNYFAGIAQGINAVTGTEVSAYGGWGQIVYAPVKSVKIGVGYGVDDPEDEDLSGDARIRNDRIFADLFYNATDNVTFGVEYSSIRTDYKESHDMQSHRVNFSAMYRF